MGKSQVVAKVAADRGMALRDIRAVLLDPVDLRGLPRLENGRAEWCPPAFLPGPDDSEQVSSSLMNERCAAIGSGRLLPACTGQANREYRLPDGWSIIAAGNREGQGRYPRMPSALANRMVHLEFDVSPDDWILWHSKRASDGK
ncbi:MAG: hypothetical protein ACLT2T_13405 [Bilophila wadsworthia]